MAGLGGGGYDDDGVGRFYDDDNNINDIDYEFNGWMEEFWNLWYWGVGG